MRILRLILSIGLCLLANPQNARAIIVTGESIEWVVDSSDRVCVGKVIKVERVTGAGNTGSDKNAYEIATIAIQQTLKGVHTEQTAFAVPVGYLGPLHFAASPHRAVAKEYHYAQQWLDERLSILFCLVENDGKRTPFRGDGVAWALRSAVLLGKSGYKQTGCIRALTRDFRVLTDKDAILEHVTRRVKATPEQTPLKSFTINVPTKTAVFNTLWSRSSVFLIVPVDGELERYGRAECNSSDSFARAEGAQILGHFKNENNIAILTSLLADPAESTQQRWTAKDRKTRIYHVRQQAFDALRQLGVKVQQPVLEELLEGSDRRDLK